MKHVIGIDLSGPSNVADTAVVAFRVKKGGELQCAEKLISAGDEAIMNCVREMAACGEVVIGLDAPLSYNPGGGLRPSDRALRQKVKGMLHPGSIMAPTMNRMVYLTLRGIAVARMLNRIAGVRIAEVHPGAVLALGGAPISAVKSFKRDPDSRLTLLHWLEVEGMIGICESVDPSDHFIAACAAALGAHKWLNGNVAWQHTATLPLHPYDFVA